MNVDVIGTNAGTVWAALNLKNAQSIKLLKKTLKFKDKDLFPALGWLAREGKIAFSDVEGDVVVTLL